jgi:para-nitrobenzyl esterase
VERTTVFGPVRGSDDRARNGTWCWKGVPYAQPPVGALRWRAPADPLPWSTTRQATDFAAASKQTGRLYGPGAHNRYDPSIGATLGQPLGEEDSLYLNIWQADTPDTAPLPVLVWVHGGSNVCGYTADPVYDGATLTRAAGMVVVSVAYRLGIFGFLDLPALHTGDPCEDAGNFALLDILQALAFVQHNIAAFGGDPGCVTLMGQSAGAVNVLALLTSPMVCRRARPLFHRLVALSGGISTAATLPPGGIATVPDRGVTRARANALVSALLVAEGSASDEDTARALAQTLPPGELAARLRAAPADSLLEHVRTRLAPRSLAAAQVIPDGWVVATDPITAIREGRHVRVPVLAGTTRDEGRLFPAHLALRPDLGGASGRRIDDAEVFAIAWHNDPERPATTTVAHWIPAACLPVDAPGTGFAARCARLTACWFEALRDDLLDALASRQPEVWCYRFDWNQLPAPFDTLYGAAHAFDLPFLFGNFGPSLHARIAFTQANSAGRIALSRSMMASLGAFARSGDPNHPALGRPWRAWPRQLVFDATAADLRLTGG